METIDIPPSLSRRAAARLEEIARKTGRCQVLAVAVLGGGCSGFRYDLRLEAPEALPEDVVWVSRDGQSVAVDAVSLPLLSGAEIDFEDELIGARFVVRNPNAVSGCGCGTSFAI